MVILTNARVSSGNEDRALRSTVERSGASKPPSIVNTSRVGRGDFVSVVRPRI